MIIYVGLLVSVIGALMYALSVNPKLQEIGRLAFACGLLAFLLVGVDKLVTVLPR